MANFGLSLMPMSQLTIEDTWFMVGMKGTGSNTIVAKDVFVPEHRFLPYPQAFAGSYRTEFKHEVVYRVDLVPVTVLILAGSQIGVARAALEHVVGKSPTRGITHTNFATQVESAGFQMQVADAAMKIDTAVLHAQRAADDLDRASERVATWISPSERESGSIRPLSRSTAAKPWKCSSPRMERRVSPTPIVCSACGAMCTPRVITRSPSGK